MECSNFDVRSQILQGALVVPTVPGPSKALAASDTHGLTIFGEAPKASMVKDGERGCSMLTP